MNLIRTDINEQYTKDGLNKLKEIYTLWKKEGDPEHAFIMLEHWFKGYVKNPKIKYLSSFNEFITNLTNKKIWLLPTLSDDRSEYIKNNNIDLNEYDQLKISYTDYYILIKKNDNLNLIDMINLIFSLIKNEYEDIKSLNLN